MTYRRGPAPASLPIGPLLAVVGDCSRSGVHTRGPAAEIMERTGYSTSTVQRWMTKGTISHDSADRCAIRFGCHPVELWPDFHDTPWVRG